MKGVRYREDAGFEGLCDYCADWWPLDAEFWIPKGGLRRCRACTVAIQREKLRVFRSDPEVRARHREASNANRRAKLEPYQEVRRSWYAKNRERLNAEKRADYAAAKAVLGLTTRPRMTDEERREIRRQADLAYHASHRAERNAANRVAYYIRRLSAGKTIKPSQRLEVERVTDPEQLARRRAYKRDWMRRNRAQKAA